MQANKPTSGLLALLMITGFAGLVTVPTVSAADQCKDNGADLGCDFDCLKGENVYVSVQGNDDDYWGHASCGFVSAYCPQAPEVHACSDSSVYSNPEGAHSAGDGSCSGNSGSGRGAITCASTAGGSEAVTLILELLEDQTRTSQVECARLAIQMEAAGITSLIHGWLEDGDFEPVFQWSRDTGCSSTTASASSGEIDLDTPEAATSLAERFSPLWK